MGSEVLRVSVIGAGPMGRLHARAIERRASQRGDCELGFIVDRHEARREDVAREFGGTARDGISAVLADAQGLAQSGRAAAIVAVPTAAHGEITKALLAGGVDVLLEKPMTGCLETAARLVEQAKAQARVFAVGHVEWFNPTLHEAWKNVSDPRDILIERMNPESRRGLDIDVVQDFMLHDLDWLRRSVGSEVESIGATGGIEGGPGLDVAEARLCFASGVRAQVRASRVHGERCRRIQIEGLHGGEGVRVDADLLSGEISIRGEEGAEGINAEPARPRRASDETRVDEPLDRQLADFLKAVRQRSLPANDAQVGLDTLVLVERIRDAIDRASKATDA